MPRNLDGEDCDHCCRGKAPAKMDGLIASLEAKYSKSTARKGKGKREPSVDPGEPSAAQFEAARYVHSGSCAEKKGFA